MPFANGLASPHLLQTVTSYRQKHPSQAANGLARKPVHFPTDTVEKLHSEAAAAAKGGVATSPTDSGAPPRYTFTAGERFLFDLNGFVILRGVFSERQVAMMNEVLSAYINFADRDFLADDRMRGESSGADSPYSGYRRERALKNAMETSVFGAQGSRRDVGLFKMLKWFHRNWVNEKAGKGSVSSLLGLTAGGTKAGVDMRSPREEADKAAAQGRSVFAELLNARSTALRSGGASGQAGGNDAGGAAAVPATAEEVKDNRDAGITEGMYGPTPYEEHEGVTLFKQLLSGCHPRLAAGLNALCGPGFRLDHQPMCITQEADSEGFALHGGPLVSSGEHPKVQVGDAGAQVTGRLDPGHECPELNYKCHNGQMSNALLAMSVALCDANPGDGGFCVVRGSHKLNFAVPDEITHGDFAGTGDGSDGGQVTAWTQSVNEFTNEHLHQPSLRAGDVILFSEATVHGALPWRADRERRLALVRFSPATLSYGRGYLGGFGVAGAGLNGLAEVSAGGTTGKPGFFENDNEASSKQQSDPSELRFSPAQLATLAPPFAIRMERGVLDYDHGPGGTVGPAVKPRAPGKLEHDLRTFGTRYF